MTERLLITSASAAVGLSFAREKVKQLRAIGADFSSKSYRFNGFTVVVRIIGDDDYIIITDPCNPQHGHLLTASFEPAEFPGMMPPTTIYWATFPTFKTHASGAVNGTYRITQSTPAEVAAGLTWPENIQGIKGSSHPLEWEPGEEKTRAPKNYPTYGFPNPSSADGTGTAARWPSLFTGYMRLVAQMALASTHGNVFSPKWGLCHGAIPVKDDKGKVKEIWVVEISSGVYVSKMTAQCGVPEVDQFIKDLLPKETPEELGYKLSFPGQISLSWVFNYRKDQKLVKKLSGKTYENRGSPLSMYRGWAFSYSGTCAECVLFSPTAKGNDSVPGSNNAYMIENLALDIYMDKDGPTAANVTARKIVDPYVSAILLWHPSDILAFTWEQLPLMSAKLLHPPTECDDVPLDVFFVGDNPKRTTVTQGVEIMGPAVVTDSAGACLGGWRFAKPTYPPGPGGASASWYTRKEDSRTVNVDRVFSWNTPAGAFDTAPVGEITEEKWEARYSGSESWLAKKRPSGFVTGNWLIYEQFGWQIVRQSWHRETASSRGAAIVLDYFDRESMFFVTYKEDWVRDGGFTQRAWAFTAKKEEPVGGDEFDAATEGTSGSPSGGWEAADACHTVPSGRFTALGGYSSGTDPPPETWLNETNHEEFTIRHALPGGVVRSGSVRDTDKQTMNRLLEFRNPKFGMSPYEGVSLYSMSSAACTIPVPPPKKPKTTATRIEGSRIVLNRITTDQYEGPIPEPTGPTVYKGYAGLI